jgi:hypothetical protein
MHLIGGALSFFYLIGVDKEWRAPDMISLLSASFWQTFWQRKRLNPKIPTK